MLKFHSQASLAFLLWNGAGAIITPSVLQNLLETLETEVSPADIFFDFTIEHEVAINDWVFNKNENIWFICYIYWGRKLVVFWFCTPPVSRKWWALFLRHLKEAVSGYDMYFWLISNFSSSLLLRFCAPHTLWNNHKSVAAAVKSTKNSARTAERQFCSQMSLGFMIIFQHWVPIWCTKDRVMVWGLETRVVPRSCRCSLRAF